MAQLVVGMTLEQWKELIEPIFWCIVVLGGLYAFFIKDS